MGMRQRAGPLGREGVEVTEVEGNSGPGAAGPDTPVAGITAATGDLSIPPPDGEEGFGRSVEERFAARLRMNVPDRHNPRLQALMEAVNADEELYALWLAANVNAIERLGMTDHGPVHVKIVMNIAVRMLRLLMEQGVEPGVVTNYGMGPDDAEVVVAAAALLHDVGMSIHRENHEEYSLFLATERLRALLPPLYGPREAAIIRSEILHAIIAHRSGGVPLTLEAGVVRLADALDMAKGRSRIPFESGSVSIHSISAAAVEGVRLEAGSGKPVRVCIQINNSAGVYQLDQLLRKKLAGSGLERYVEVHATLEGEGEVEKRLFRTFTL